jgi:type II secretory pathway pseudopilin PulG
MRLSNKKSFTLVEALFAAVIMGIGLLTLITAIYSQTAILNENRERTIANLAVQGEIENIRGMKFSGIPALTSFDEDDAPGLAYLHYGSGFGKGDIKVDSAGFTSDPHIKKVSVTVTWNSINGKTLRKTMATLVTENGINKQ